MDADSTSGDGESTLDRIRRILADRYDIQRELGRGGMATVFLARDKKHARDVAVKVLDPELSVSIGTERFQQEITLAAGLTHPHILSIHDSGVADGLLYYVMPLLEGESLRDRLRREKQLSLEDATRIAREIAGAVDYAHQQGIIHRDIKPENIMFAAGHAVLADFGIARAVMAAGEDRLTRTGVVVGTPAYMSPEQATGASEVDARSDVYAMGCVLYEMLAGHAPFTGATAQAVVIRHLTDPVPSIRAARATIPPNVEGALSRALEKTPADRFSSAAEFAAALLMPQGGETATGTVAKTTMKMPAIPSRPRRSIVATAGAIVLVGGSVLLAFGGLDALFGGRDSPLDRQRTVVAVFDNLTGDPELDPVGRMAADWSAQGLSQLDGVEVVPSLAVLRLASAGSGAVGMPSERERMLALADETGAATVISGAYYLTRDTIRFQVRITDVVGDTLLRPLEPVSAPASAPMEAVEELQQRLMSALALSVGVAPTERALIRRPPSYEAYREYLAGLDYWMGDFPRAAGHFSRAFQLDSTFFAAGSALAISFQVMGQTARASSIFLRLDRDRDQLTDLERYVLDAFMAPNRRQAMSALRAADAIDPKNPIIKHLLGLWASRENQPDITVRSYAELESVVDPAVLFGDPYFWLHFEHLTQAHHLLGAYDDELAEARRARLYYPDVLDVRWYEARALAALGRVDEISDLVSALTNEQFRAGRPGTQVGGVLRAIAAELRAHGHPDEAREYSAWSLTWLEEHGDQAGDEQIAASLYEAGRFGEARNAYEQLVTAEPSNWSLQTRLAEVAAIQGDTATAMRISATLATLDDLPDPSTTLRWRAGIAALLGDLDGATELLGEYFAAGGAMIISLHSSRPFAPHTEYGPIRQLMRPKS